MIVESAAAALERLMQEDRYSKDGKGPGPFVGMAGRRSARGNGR